MNFGGDVHCILMTALDTGQKLVEVELYFVNRTVSAITT